MGDIPHKLLRLELTDWPGISKGREARFHSVGVRTTAQMYALPIKEMRDVFGGIEGERWWRSLRGLNVDRPPFKRSSVGHSNVLAPEFRNPEAARSVVFRMLEKSAERFFANTGAEIRHGGTQAYYAPALDYVQMPLFETFRDAESHAATLAHELTHWTRHTKRLARDFGRVRHGDEGYAKEELVAELGAAFLSADLGIVPEVRRDHAA